MYSAITLSLIALCVIFLLIKTPLESTRDKYPTSVNCDEVSRSFDDAAPGEYLKFAQIDQTPTLNMEGSGIYQCFCKDTMVDRMSPMIYFTIDESEFCYDWVKSFY